MDFQQEQILNCLAYFVVFISDFNHGFFHLYILLLGKVCEESSAKDKPGKTIQVGQTKRFKLYSWVVEGLWLVLKQRVKWSDLYFRRSHCQEFEEHIACGKTGAKETN